MEPIIELFADGFISRKTCVTEMALHVVTPYCPLSLSILEKDDGYMSCPGSQMGKWGDLFIQWSTNPHLAVAWRNFVTTNRSHGHHCAEWGAVNSTSVLCPITRFLVANFL